MNLKECLKQIEEGKSLIRYGDGEIFLINYGSMSYEPFNEDLRDGLLTVVKEYSPSSPYILCLNEHVMNRSNTELRDAGQLHTWLPSKVAYKMHFNKDVPYADASMFYRRDVLEKQFASYLLTRNMIVVTHKETIDALKFSPLFASTHFVETPKINAWAYRDDIHEAINAQIEKVTRPTILLACGPLSKILAYEYAKQGIQALDIGVGIEYVGKSYEPLERMVNYF